jgi:O-antigen ligase
MLRSDALYTGLAIILMSAAVWLIAGGLLSLPPGLVIALLPAFAAVVVMIRNPFWGIMLFLCLLFVRVEFFFYGGLPVIGKSGFPILSALVVSLTLFAWPLQLILKRETFQWRTELGWAAAFAFITFLSSYNVPGLDYTTNTLLDVLKLIGIFFLLQQLLRTEQRVETALQLLLLYVLILGMCGIYGWVTGTEPVPFIENGQVRASVAGVYNPNALAGALAMASPIALITILRGRTWWWRVWGLAALGVLLVGIYLTNSRGGILAVGVGLGVVLIQQLGWLKGFVLAALAGALLIACGPSRLGESAALVSQEGMQADESNMGRVIAWRHGLEMFEKHPILGVGFNQFPVHSPIEAHNAFVQALAEGGFPNAVCFVGFNYWAVLALVRLRRARRAERGPEPTDRPQGKDDSVVNYATAVMGGLFALFVTGISSQRAYDYEAWVWVGLASALGVFNPEKAKSRLRDWPHYAAVLAITLSLLAWVYLVVHVLKD